MMKLLVRGASLSAKARAVALATAGVLALTLIDVPRVYAADARAPGSVATAPAAATDFSARRRHRGVRHYRGGHAAGLAFMGMMIGTIGAIAAAERRDRYYDRVYAEPYAVGPYQGYDGGYGYAPAPQPVYQHAPQYRPAPAYRSDVHVGHPGGHVRMPHVDAGRIAQRVAQSPHWRHRH